MAAAFDGATALDVACAKNNRTAVELLTSMGGCAKTTCQP